MTALTSFYDELSKTGWSCRETGLSSESELIAAVLETARELGAVMKGRHSSYVERLESLAKDRAPASSLSAQFGRGEFPCHIDMAHLPVPCRYIVLGCGFAKERPAATLIQIVGGLRFSPDEMDCLRSGVFLVRNGRRSFFASVLGGRRRFFRWDPGCMLAKDEYARAAQAAIERELGAIDPVRHQWRAGSILVLDNWKVLHGRESCHRDGAQRVIYRSSVS